jgi:hypothetical protein
MLRFLIGLLIGTIVGVVGTAYFFSTGGGDYLIASSPRVRHLEEALNRANQELERMAKKLEEAAATIEKVSAKFAELERQVHISPVPPQKFGVPGAEEKLEAEQKQPPGSPS